ncbi:uncharacterized protein LOC130644510 [Hydractinia symbiolongicarpus]|uniref:uncharacterized protein LOC130644510 n=1 Tax=Hydractinia symbiolongicarpus TaxID=13093 RepID=UPI00254A47D9|nr:uncharacterized protein LOC130644510 [Hydractinia symbiolongicarpus]
MLAMRVNSRIIVIKFLIGDRIVTFLSVYVPQCGLGEEDKDKFYDELIAVTSKFGDTELIMVGGDFNGHVGKSSEGYRGVHVGYGFGSRNKEGERLLEFGMATDMVVCNTSFSKRQSRLITYESGGCKTQIDYFLVRKSDKKVVKDVKVISGEECVSQHRLLVCDIILKSVKEAKGKYRPRRKVWKLKEEIVARQFSAKVHQLAHNGQCDSDNVESTWTTSKNCLLEASDDTCGWTKGPARHRQTWWWNNEVDQCIKEKRKLWKEWKSGGSKNIYLEAKRHARTAVYKAKSEAERNRFADVLRREDQRNEVFKIAKQMKKTNQDVVGEKCICNDEGVLASTEEEKRVAWKNHYQSLIGTRIICLMMML